MSNTDDQSSKYPTQAHGSIPAFHNVEEEATFFDTHDFSDFWNELRPAEFGAPIQKMCISVLIIL